MFFKFWFKPKPVKKIAFLDGDQPLPGIIDAHKKYLIGTETHLIRLRTEGHNIPKILNRLRGVNQIYLTGYTSGKEVVDKFIGAYIQKSVQDGYKHITVVSSDYDFIDIFKMALVLNPTATDVTFRILVPHAQGRLIDTPAKIANIEIVRI